MGAGARLPSRGNSYGQPAAAELAPTNAEGRFAQPAKSGYIISGPMSPSERDPQTGRPLSQQFPSEFQSRPSTSAPPERPRHKRTSTMESFTTKIFGRSNSTRRQSQQQQVDENTPQGRVKKGRAYPPVSMKNTMSNDEPIIRQSTDSRRSSFGFGRRDSEDPSRRSSKRFSFLPQAFSRMSLSKDEYPSDNKRSSMQAPPRSRHDSKAPPSGMAFGQGRSRSPSDESNSTIPVLYDSNLDRVQRKPLPQPVQRGATAPDLSNYASNQQQQYSAFPPREQEPFYSPSQSQETNSTDLSANNQYQARSNYPPGFNEHDSQTRTTNRQQQQQHQQQSGLQKNNRKFGEAYEGGGNAGSSGGARRVMDWFRKRGRERAG